MYLGKCQLWCSQLQVAEFRTPAGFNGWEMSHLTYRLTWRLWALVVDSATQQLSRTQVLSSLPSLIRGASVLKLLLLYFQMINIWSKKRCHFLPFLSFRSPKLFQKVPSKFTVTSYWLLWGHTFILNHLLIGDWDYPWANQIQSLWGGWVQLPLGSFLDHGGKANQRQGSAWKK